MLAWFLPMIWLSGGLAAYLAASTQLDGSVVLPPRCSAGRSTSRFAQARYLLESVLVGLGPLALALRRAARRTCAGAGWGRPEWFLLAWIAAARGLLHARALRAGGLRADLPARAGDPAARARWWRRSRRAPSGCAGRNWRWALTAAALVRARARQHRLLRRARARCRASSTTGPAIAWIWRARDEIHDWIISRTAAALREHEAVIRTYVETIRAVYDPDDTALLTELGNPRSYPWLRHAMFYLPEYPIYQLQLGDAARLLRARSPRRP